MPLKEYRTGTAFPGVIGRTVDVSQPAWPQPRRAKEGAPNVLFIVQDDTGFGQMGCYGSPIETPNIDNLAENGLLFNSMHTTALCSPTRSCILTGRNHHSNAMSCITEGSTGFPGSNGYIPFENGFLPEILLQHGYNTFALGKWHLTPGHRVHRGGALRPLAAGPRVRAVLRVSGRRHAPVLSGADLRQPLGRTAQDAGGGLSLHRGYYGQGDQLHRRCQAERAEQAVLHVLLPGRRACAPPCAQGVGGQVQGPVRHGLGQVQGDGLRTPEETGHRPRRMPSSPATIPMSSRGTSARPRRRRSMPG